MHEKNSQFILLKIPPHVVSLLGKIHALSIEILLIFKPYREKTCLMPYANNKDTDQSYQRLCYTLHR